MSTLIAVPTKSRSEEFSKNTYRWLQYCYTDYAVFVEPQDYEKYRYVGEEHLIQLPDNNRGLGYAKGYIKDFALHNGYTAVFKVDDDISGWVDLKRKSRRGKPAAEYFEFILGFLENKLRVDMIGAIGFPYRNEMWEVKDWTSVNSRLQTCYLIRTELMFADERISTFEDFATFTHLRLNNYITVRCGVLGMDLLPVAKTKGGLQDFNRAEQAEREILLLREMYPALKVRKVVGKPWQYEPDLKGGIFKSTKL